MSARRALVTGASSGIGEACARLLSSEGYRVALLARRGERLESLRAELGDGHLSLVCDVRDAEAIERAARTIDDAFGGLDLVVNNAGVGYRARVDEMQPELLRATFDTNVIAPLLVCRSMLPLLRRGSRPVVVNVASVVGRRGIPGQAAYAASKAALVSIGEALRIEWKREGIAVCTLSPALTSTGFFDAQPNPSHLPPPDLATSAAPIEIARHVLVLDRDPRPEVSLRWKWKVLAFVSLVAPRLADRMLERRIGWTER